LRLGIGRLFLIVDGKVPATVCRDKRTRDPSTRIKFMDTNEPWWREGVIIFSKVSGYIVVPIILASYIGKSLDQKYNTEPKIFLVSVGIAFIFTILLIWREMKVYKKKLDISAKAEKQEKR
jgi:hypothetical protein